MTENIDFFKRAYEALIERGIITKDKLQESKVTDEMIEKLESDIDVMIPDDVRNYLKSYSHTIQMLCAAVPENYVGKDSDIMHEINEMTPEEIANVNDDDAQYLTEYWSDILQVPEDDPLSILKENILGFREYADVIDGINQESLKKFVPIGDWMSAGPLCIDTEKSKNDINIDDPNTWQVRWFDHEVFDWKKEGYIDEEGNVIGLTFFPDFKTFIKLYFFGIYDKLYDKQMKDEGENTPDRSKWYEDMKNN